MIPRVTVRKEQQLRVTVERDVREKLVRYRLKVLGQTLCFDIRECGTSGVCLHARIRTGATG